MMMNQNNNFTDEPQDMLVLDDTSGAFAMEDDSASTTGATPTGGGHKQPSKQAQDDDDDELQVAQQENRAVWCLRIVVFTLLMSVALAICLMVYFLASASEQEDFERGFEEMSLKVVEGFESTLQQRLGIIQGLSMDLTAYEENTPNVTFPFVTLPYYEQRAGHVGKLADLFSAAFFPMIDEADRYAFDQYANTHQDWWAEGMSYRTGLPLKQVQAQLPPMKSSIWGIYKDKGPDIETRPGPYTVQWQGFPATPQLPVLMNVGTHPHYIQPLAHVVEYKQPVFPPSYDFMDPASHSKDPRRPMIQSFLDSYESYGTGVKYLDDPVMPLLYPIFQAATGKVAGVLICGVYWRTYFRQLLPRGANGVHVILQNTCGQEYTYKINGAEAQFVGHGDLHDPQYDGMKAGLDLRSYSNKDKATGNCMYGIRVYPSQEFEDGYTSSKPLLYTLVLVGVFLFTSMAFIVYDYCVERRQRLVLKSATQSGALVSSLFPEVVRQRLYEEQQKKQQQQKKNKNTAMTWKYSTDDNDSDIENSGDGNGDTSKPHEAIANLYPECTVLFADIVGFTSWSSTRSPQEVFQLLETIYEAFDKVAVRGSIFKVETIGDCYVACTGIPHAQPDHAVRMCRFAQCCMKQLQELIHCPEVLDRLGHDTNTLAMRFGLHSGPVTAGVLRGSKSRFQIFGDTVNTAARMESNGLPHKIQVSEATAELLREAGKGDWIVPRPDLVAAKGKGSLQTYWVTATRVAAPTSTMGDSDYSASHCSAVWKQALPANHNSSVAADHHHQQHPKMERIVSEAALLQLEPSEASHSGGTQTLDSEYDENMSV